MRDRFYDNTRLSTAKSCLRKYLFRHILDWDSSGFNKDLVFGSAWHEAMDVLWTTMASDDLQTLNTQEIAEIAYQGFITEWLSSDGPDPRELGLEDMNALGVKTPMIALEMLYEYVDARRAFFSDPTFKLLAVEQSFAVPLDPNDSTLFYVGRMDKVFEKQGLIYAAEHKTSSAYSISHGFQSTFLDSFSPNSQIDGYLHALHMLYGDKATGVWVDAALCHKKIHNVFQFIPIDRRHEQLDAWMYDTHWWINAIEDSWGQLERIEKLDEKPSFIQAFPKNTGACMDYGRACPYIGPCKMVPNPMEMDPPPGFTVSRWSPFNRLELSKIGMEGQEDSKDVEESALNELHGAAGQD